MAYYESVFIARQDISAPQVESLADGFAAVIEENGGKVTKRESWGLRGLAYKIKKNRKGHYVLFNLDAPAAAIHEMERQMRLNEDILRHMTLRIDELEEGPSIQMQGKANQEERSRRREAERFDESKAGDKKPAATSEKADAKPDKEQTSAADAEPDKEQTSATDAEPDKEQTSAADAKPDKEQTSAADAKPDKEQTSAADDQSGASDTAEGEDK